MHINHEKLLKLRFEEIEHSYTYRDTILYALGIGLGYAPLDEKQLKFVYEDGLQALPSMSVILAYPGFWLKDMDSGVDWTKVLHVGHEIESYRPLPVAGTVVARTRIVDVIDKGEGKGTLISYSRTIRDKKTSENLCSITQTILARGDGGWGGPQKLSNKPHPIPERSPDLICEFPTMPQAALIYRLSGDYNPLHAVSSLAKSAGFDAPILHGLCTYGIACFSLLKMCCNYNVTQLDHMKVRFSSVVYPGETIRTEIWRDGSTISFRCLVVERGIVALNNGYAKLNSQL
jgi:acyl dehydratase